MAERVRIMSFPYSKIYIYALLDPFTNEYRYIGKSVRPKERFIDHCKDKSNCHRVHWIQSVIKKGSKPILQILEELPAGADWPESERPWIALAREQGWPLTNGTDGGDGVIGLSEECRKRISKTWIGRKHKPETLLKISASSKERRHTPERREYMRELMTGRTFTEEWSDKIAEAIRAFDDATIDEIKAKIDAGARTKDLAAEYGVHRTTISKIKMGTYKNRYRPKSAA